MKKIVLVLPLILSLISCSNSSQKNYDLINETSNEMSCYNVLSYIYKTRLPSYYPNADFESLTLISGHGDTVTGEGQGIIYLSYSYVENSTKFLKNESYSVNDYGLISSSNITFRSEESSCENVSKEYSSFINVEMVNYYFEKYKNSTLIYEKNTYHYVFKNYDATILEEKDIEGYGTRFTSDIDSPTKPSTEYYDYEFQYWTRENGYRFDFIARKSETLTASYKQVVIKHNVSLFSGTNNFMTLEARHNEQINVCLYQPGAGNTPIYSSITIKDVEDDTWFLFDGWEEEELIESSYQVSTGGVSDIDKKIAMSYKLKPVTSDIELHAKWKKRFVYDVTTSVGGYSISLNSSLMNHYPVYNNTGDVVIPSQAFEFDSNGNKNVLGDVTSIGSMCFCPGITYGQTTNTILKSVVFPATIKSIGDNAFRACRNYKNIILNSGVETIGSSAFYCTEPKLIYLPKSIKTINGLAFDGKYASSSFNEENVIVIYEGSESDWNKININSSNRYILNSNNIIFNTTYEEYISNH